MKKLVKDSKQNSKIRMTALSLVQSFQQKDFTSEARAIHQYVRDNIRYVKDINGVETLHTPEMLLQIKQGDCDDKSLLAAALLESIGHPTRFVAISLLPGKFCHVYTETKIGSEWIGVETTEPVPLGWKPKSYERIVIYN